MIACGCLCGLALSGLAGCSSSPTGMIMSGGKAAYQVIGGAEAKVRPLRGASPAGLAAYRAVRIGEVTTDLPGIVSDAALRMVRTDMGLGLAEKSKEGSAGGRKGLVAQVVCRFAKERGMFGGEARLDMLVTLVDDQTGNEVARVFIEGLSRSPLHGKIEHMAKENGKELARYLSRRQKGEPDQD